MATALTEICGGTAEHVENAAEIDMEHNLGFIYDPVGGLAQIPCLERNAVSSVKAIRTMTETSADMEVEDQDTSRGAPPVGIVEGLPVRDAGSAPTDAELVATLASTVTRSSPAAAAPLGASRP